MPLKLQEIIDSVKETLIKTNSDYDIVVKRLSVLQLEISHFQNRQKEKFNNTVPNFCAGYTQQPLILYQLETVPVPIVDKNPKADSYTQLQIKKPYLALNLETLDSRNWLHVKE